MFSAMLAATTLAAVAFPAHVRSAEWASHTALPPAGVSGARTLPAGSWLVRYRYDRIARQGNRDGTRRNSIEAIRGQGFRVIPTEMLSEIHTLGVMVAPFDRLTLSATLPLLRIEMDLLDENGNVFTTRSRGVGDLELTALVPFIHKGQESLHVQLGLSLPTGSIRKRDKNPVVRERLPYPLQLGSGTVDLITGATYLGQRGPHVWGLQVNALIHLGENSLDYSVGDALEIAGWFERRWTNWLGTSLRLAWSDWDNVSGRDAGLDSQPVPAAASERQGGARLELGPGLHIAPPALAGQRIAFEATWPVYQSLSGPQLEADWRLTAGWEWAF